MEARWKNGWTQSLTSKSRKISFKKRRRFLATTDTESPAKLEISFITAALLSWADKVKAAVHRGYLLSFKIGEDG